MSKRNALLAISTACVLDETSWRHAGEALGRTVEFAKDLLRCCTRPGDLVLDPYIGAGTTAVACIRLGRRCIGCDISGFYLGLARQRVDFALAARPTPQP